MATVFFYEKPNCGTNARQRRMLEAAGHTVVAASLLAEPWTAERLLSFFGDTPVSSWINPASPRVKSGEIDPEVIERADALAHMLKDPLLIRRPLVEANGQKCAGFDREPVASLLSGLDLEGVQACTRPAAAACPDPHESGKPS